MKHSVNELYHIPERYGHHYTREGLAAAGIQIAPPRTTRHNTPGMARAHGYLQNSKGYITIHDAEGDRVVYLYGEKTWFDAKEERDAYRAAANAEYERTKARNRIKREICDLLDSMSFEDMKKTLEMLKRGV